MSDRIVAVSPKLPEPMSPDELDVISGLILMIVGFIMGLFVGLII